MQGSLGRGTFRCPLRSPTSRGGEDQCRAVSPPAQVPAALRWPLHQRVQQDERERSGSEIHSKPHGPQAQVRAQLPGDRKGGLGHAGCWEAGLTSEERGVA